MNNLLLILLIMLGVAITFFVLTAVMAPVVQGLNEDAVYICVSAVWNDNKIICKEYTADDVPGLNEVMHEIYAEFMQELDTWEYGNNESSIIGDESSMTFEQCLDDMDKKDLTHEQCASMFREDE